MGDQVTRRDFLIDFLQVTAAFALGGAALSAQGAPAEARAKPSSRSTKLPQRILGRTEERVSMLGLGGAWFLSTSTDKELAQRHLNHAIDGGINYFDTAPATAYGNSEAHMGLVMAKRRKEIFLATKVEDRTYEGTLKQVEASLKSLQTDYLDLLQVHYVSNQDNVAAFGGPQGVIRALERLRHEKVIRYIGITGHPEFAEVKQALAMYDCWDTFLGFINPLLSTRPMYEEQLPIAQRKQMGIIGMKIYGGGDPPALVGEAPGKAPAALLLRYALSQAVTTVIPAISNLEQLDANLKVARHLTPLTAEEREALVGRLNPAPARKLVIVPPFRFQA